jgi:hypothetical protein
MISRSDLGCGAASVIADAKPSFVAFLLPFHPLYPDRGSAPARTLTPAGAVPSGPRDGEVSALVTLRQLGR